MCILLSIREIEIVYDPGWIPFLMMNSDNAGRILAAALAVCFSAFMAPVLWVKLGAIPALLVSSTFAGGFYLVVSWLMVDRPAEVKRKVPISSKELRRRTKLFYDWLASQGNARK
jgi:hypothetical protein